MKLVGKILLGIFLIIVLILVGTAIYIDLPVFENANEFSNYISSYNQIKYKTDNGVKTLNAFERDSLINKEIKEIKVNGDKVIVSYFRFKDPFTARNSINKYKELHTGNFMIKTVEVNIPLYGKYWVQTAQGITNISWTRNRRVILIRSKSRETAKMVEEDIKSYFN